MLRDRELCEQAFRRTYGLEPAGYQDIELGAEAMQADLKKLFQQGALFHLRVQDLFEAVCERFQSSKLEILVPADGEFLLGDVPALTIDFRSGAAGVRAGVGLNNANTIILPLGPRLLVALSHADAVDTAPRLLVDQVNKLQVQAAFSFVYHRLGADFSGRIAEWRSEATC